MTSVGTVADDVSGCRGRWRQQMTWQMMSPRADVSRGTLARGSAWRRVEEARGAWLWRRDFWWRVGARGRSDEDEISQKGRAERFLSDGVICGLIGEAEAVVAARQWSLMYWSRGGGSGAAHNNGCRWHPRRQDYLRAAHQRIRVVALILKDLYCIS